MAATPKSYGDPYYATLSQTMERKFGLPEGLLSSIVTKGERSNSDQVSSKGARTVFQITPQTRKAAIDQYGVDAYKSAENAAEVAARLLKDSLQRNDGDVGQAVGEYHGGTDRTNWGPKTKAYVSRVTGEGQSTFDRVKAKTGADQAPSIAKVYDAYKAGKLAPEEARQFEADVTSGAVMLPRGAKIEAAKPTGQVLPAGVVQAYNSQSEMSDAERGQLDKDLADGLVALPQGVKLQRPAARSLAEVAGMKLRNVAGGVADLADLPAGSINSLINLVPGAHMSVHPFRDIVDAGAQQAGIPLPATKAEKLTAAIEGGAAQGLATAGMAPALGAATSLQAGAADILGSAAAGGASETARQHGAGPIGQFVAGLAGGGVTAAGAAGAVRGAEAVAAKFGAKAARMVEAVPKAAALDGKGHLTDEGREVAARSGLTHEEVRGAYDEAEAANKPPPGIPDDDVVGQSLFSTRPSAPVGSDVPDPAAKLEAAGVQGARIVGHDPALGPVMEGLDWPSARQALETLQDGDAQAVLMHPAVGPVDVIWGNERGGLAHILDKHPGDLGDDFADEFAGMQVRRASRDRVELQSPERDAVVALDYDGKRKRWLLTAFKRDGNSQPAGDAPQPGGLGGQAAQSPDQLAGEDIAQGQTPANARARLAEAKAEGVDLTKGQATQDFAAQSAESDLAATQGPEGQKVRDHFAQQAEQIKAAVAKFQTAFGDASLGATERGQQVKDAIRELADQGKAGVSRAYEQARQLAEQAGQGAADLIRLDVAPLRQAIRDILIDDTVDEKVRKGLTQIAAKYGVIGEQPRHIEATGNTTVYVRDHEGELVKGPTFPGQVEPLDLTNAERFRQRINDLYDKMASRNPQEALKPIVDQAVAEAAERAAANSTGDVGAAFNTARQAHQTQARTFKSGDVVQDIIAWKKGERGTEQVNPEGIFQRIFAGGAEGLTNLRKIKAVLLSKGTDQSKAAWSAIQAHAIGQIFNKATVVNANLAGDLGAISGAKLNSEIARFGVEKLKVLLSAEDFNQLMKLKRVIGHATIPLKGTTNPSGTGGVFLRFMAKQAKALSPVAKMVPFVRPVVQGAEEFAAKRAEKATLEGVTNFSPEAATKTDNPKAKADPTAFARQYLRLAGSDQILAPIMAAAANEDHP